MRVLVITNKVKKYALGFQNIIDTLADLGHDVVWAADFSSFVGDRSAIPCITEQIDINTNPLNPTNMKALKQLCEIISKHCIEAIQCSTPIGGLLGRLAGKRMHISPVIYAAHGFLFYRGAPLINWTVYKWEEQWLARYTDVLITITEEDFAAAQKFKLRSGKKPYVVHGAGVNIGVTMNVDKKQKRKDIGVPEDAFVIVSAGELNKNKNTEVVVRALAIMKDSGVHYVACGVGPEKGKLEKLAHELGVSDQFHLIGYRTDMPEIMAAADTFTIMSLREGIPRSLLEAMDLGLPCVGSNTRGIRDLISNNEGGFLCNPNKPVEFAYAFLALMQHPERSEQIGMRNKKEASKYSKEIVCAELADIFCRELQ